MTDLELRATVSYGSETTVDAVDEPVGVSNGIRSRAWLFRLLLIIGILSSMVSLPRLIQDDYVIHVLNLILFYMLAALSLDIVVGFLGELNLGQAGFVGIGAYATAIAGMHLTLGWASFWIALLLGAVVSAIAGLAVGLPALRIRGFYFMMVTLGFGEIVRLVLLNWSDVTRGAFGLTVINAPTIGAFRFSTPRHYYYLFLLLLLLAVVATVWLRYSYVGRAWIGIREDPTAAEAMGISLTRYKVLAFVVSAFFAGLGGGLLGSYLAFLHPTGFTILESLLILVMVIIGGRGLIYGALAGALLMTVLNEFLRSAVQYRFLIIGALMVIVMVARPQGILGKR